MWKDNMYCTEFWKPYYLYAMGQGNILKFRNSKPHSNLKYLHIAIHTISNMCTIIAYSLYPNKISQYIPEESHDVSVKYVYVAISYILLICYMVIRTFIV